MTTLQPLPQTFQLVTPGRTYTPEFKRFLDDLLRRVFGTRGGTFQPLSDGPTVTWDVDQKPVAYLVLGGNRTLAPATGMVAGPLSLYRLTVVQDPTGGRTLAWGGNFRFSNGTPPTLSTAPGAVDQFVFDSDGVSLNLVGGALNLL